MQKQPKTPLTITTYNLAAAERVVILEALGRTESLIDAAALLGINRHALRRRITKHRITVAKRDE